jgi:hypothetical protein
MPEYRAYAVGADGHFSGYVPLVCANDEEAATKARILARRHGVELWSGPRLVISIPKAAGQSRYPRNTQRPLGAKTSNVTATYLAETK